MTAHLPVAGARRPYVGPLDHALRLTPWVAVGAGALSLFALSMFPTGTPCTQVATGTPAARSEGAVRYVVLTPVDVVVRRDHGQGAGTVASYRGPDAVTLEP